jgi:AcrR family transcriptional regulator
MVGEMVATTSTRERLVEVATGLLEEGGPSAVTLREVGHRAGVSHNAPYKHFADKEDLLAAVAAAQLRANRATVQHLSDGRPPGEALRLVLHAYVSRAMEHPEMFRLIYGRWRTDSAELGQAAHEARSLLVSLVQAAQDSGNLPPGDPDRMTALLQALAHGAADLALSGHLAKDGKGHAEPGDLVDDLLARLATT